MRLQSRASGATGRLLTRPALSAFVLVLLAFTAQAQLLTLQQTSDTVSVPADTVATDQFTLEARLYLSKVPPPSAISMYIFREQFDGVEDKALAIYPTGFGGAAYRGAGGGMSTLTTWAPCTWVHIAFVCSGNNEFLYRDGVLLASRTVSGPILNWPNSISAIGARDYGFAGPTLAPPVAIDWLRISKVARYSGSTATIPAGQPANDADTLLLYHFGEPAGATQVTDQSSGAWTGVLGSGFGWATSPELGTGLSQPQSYCTAKVATGGCVPAMQSNGGASASSPTGFLLGASPVPPQTLGIFFYSKTGAAGSPFQGGFLCLAAPVLRGPPIFSGGSAACSGSFSADFNAYIAGGADPALVAGTTVWLQFWFRDTAAPFGSGLSNALRFGICP
jgi:hypothetical protein